MKKLAFYRLFHAVRHNLPLFILYYIAGYILAAVLVLFLTFNYLYTEHVYKNGLPYLATDSLEVRMVKIQDTIWNLFSIHRNLYFCITVLIALALIWLISRKLPLCLPRAMYVCPAGPAEKMHFLKAFLSMKALFLTALLTISCIFMTGTFFYPSPPVLAVQISLTFFTLIAFSLNPDPGNRKEALKYCPDIITEKDSRTVVNIYWSALLLLENTVFYSMLYTASSFTWRTASCWIPVLLINILIAKRYVVPVLMTMLDYEKIYYPLPETAQERMK